MHLDKTTLGKKRNRIVVECNVGMGSPTTDLGSQCYSFQTRPFSLNLVTNPIFIVSTLGKLKGKLNYYP